MKLSIKDFKPAQMVMLILLAAIFLVSGCTRYARNVNILYETTATVRGSGGEIYIVIPESQQTQSPDIKWVFGKVTDNDNNNIDEVFSPRSPAEIIQTAFGLEFKKAGYAVTYDTKRPIGDQRVIDLTKTEIELNQTSAITVIKANCRVLVGIDVIKDGQLVKRLQYEANSSNTNIKNRDLLAGIVLEEALQSVILKAMPDLINQLKN